jgi:hypothetical protein
MRRENRKIGIPAIQGVAPPSHVRGGAIGSQVNILAEAEDGSCDQGGGTAFRRFTLSRRDGLCFPRRFLRRPLPGSRRERVLSMASLEPADAGCK